MLQGIILNCLPVDGINTKSFTLPEGHAIFPLAGRQRKMHLSAHVCLSLRLIAFSFQL
jgi:hypothetical protein